MTATRKQRPAGARSPESEKGGVPIVGIVFGVVAVILVAAIVLTGGGTDEEARYGTVEVIGENLAPYPVNLASIGDDPAIGSTIPTLDGEDLEGNAMSVSADGVAQGIVFLAHWCDHCQAEVPRVTDWIETTGGMEGVDIVSVTTSINPLRDNFPPDKWLERENWPADVLLDDEAGTAHVAFGAGGFPYWVFVDAGGKVVARTAGQLDIPTLEAFLALARDA